MLHTLFVHAAPVIIATIAHRQTLRIVKRYTLMSFPVHLVGIMGVPNHCQHQLTTLIDRVGVNGAVNIQARWEKGMVME